MKTFSGRKPSQNEFELTSFIDLLNKNNVTRYLEVGARHGDTFHQIMTSLPVGSYGMAIDKPGALWGSAKTVVDLHKAAEDLRQRGYVIDVVLGDSTSPSVLELVQQQMFFDAILIDGDHRYEGVKKDWLNYKGFSSIVAFHDIVGTGQREKVHGNAVEVPRLWAEIKSERDHVVEFVDTGSLMGIGVCNLL